MALHCVLRTGEIFISLIIFAICFLEPENQPIFDEKRAGADKDGLGGVMGVIFFSDAKQKGNPENLLAMTLLFIQTAHQ